MKSLKKYIPVILCITVIAVLCIFYLTTMSVHLKWQEQNQIFIPTSDWLGTYFNKPAWLGCMAAEWLIQFFCYPVASALILSLSVAFAAFSVFIPLSRITGRPWGGAITTLIALWLISTSFNEMSSLPFILCVSGGSLLSECKFYMVVQDKKRIDFSPLIIAPAFWLFGVGSYLTALFIALRALKTRRLKGLTVVLACLLLAVVTPAILASRYSLRPSDAALYPGVPAAALPDKERLQRLAIDDAYYRDDMESAKRLALHADTPNDVTAFYYYLASARQDSLPDNLLKYPVKNLGTLTSIGESTPLPVINMMNDLYFTLGDMTYAERAAMMRNVFSPRNRNSRMLRRLAEINLASGDTLAADKYLRILARVVSQRQWSLDHTPGRMSSEAEADIMKRRTCVNRMPDLRTGDNCRFILLQLLESNHNNTVALDYLLCTDLLLKDIGTFKNDYDTYCMATGSPRYKDLYQQALMIYLAGTNAPKEEWNRYIRSQEQLDRFNAYRLRRGDRSFADTYWFYFDLQQ